MQTNNILILIAAYLRKLNYPAETKVEIAKNLLDDLVGVNDIMSKVDKKKLDEEKYDK